MQSCEGSSIGFHPNMLSELGMAAFTGDLENLRMASYNKCAIDIITYGSAVDT
jgi:hypothetical protein